MPIKYVEGDIFKANTQTIVNTVNCVGVMGKGLALKFKKRYPKMYEQYRREYEEGRLDIGKLHLYKNNADQWILNFPTKRHWRQKSRAEYIRKGLETFVENYRDWGIKSIAFPQLGCQLGSLNWKDVKPIMEHYLKNLPDLSVVICTYRPRKEERVKRGKDRTRRKKMRVPQSKDKQTELTGFVSKHLM